VSKFPIEDFEQFTFQSGKDQLSGLEFGDRKGADLILLHGIRDLAWSMAPLVREFMDEYRIVVPDLRGHGDSDNPGAYTISHFIADLRSLIMARSVQNPLFVGHSLGGQIVSQYVALYPEGVGGIVLIDGMGPPRMEGETSREGGRQMSKRNIEMMLEMEYERRQMPDADDAYQRLLRNNARLDTKTARYLADLGTEPHPEGGVQWKWVPAVNQIWSSVVHEQSEERWSWIECPVLLLTGDRAMEYWLQRRDGLSDMDDLHDREIERRRRIFRNARHVTIAEAGHMVHYDQPDTLNREIRKFFTELA
jgi:pimeloyl-ACP methyl ester carboxylesterase|tara:strand:- start:1112 stop:2032 length:921 start_codon:yes stop_codon:yes gene_type:complete